MESVGTIQRKCQLGLTLYFKQDLRPNEIPRFERQMNEFWIDDDLPELYNRLRSLKYWSILRGTKKNRMHQCWENVILTEI